MHHTIQEADDRQMPDQDKPFVSLVKGIPLSIIAKLEFLCSVIFKIVKSINKDYRTDSMKKSISIFFHCFSIKRNIIRVPMLVPGLEYTFETLVECVSDLGIADQIRVFVLRDSFPPNVIRYAYEQRFPAIFSQ